MGKIFILSESPLKGRYLSRDSKKQRSLSHADIWRIRCPAKERVSTVGLTFYCPAVETVQVCVGACITFGKIVL